MQIELKDLASTLEKLKAQHPSLYIPAGQSDALDVDNGGLPDDIKPLSDMANATPMDISRLVTHLSKIVQTMREEVSVLLQNLQPLKEKIIMLKDDCDEKKKVNCSFSFVLIWSNLFVTKIILHSWTFWIYFLQQKKSMVFIMDKWLSSWRNQTYNALQTQLNTEYAMMQSEISETENSIKELERTWNHLQVTYKNRFRPAKWLLKLKVMNRQTLK